MKRLCFLALLCRAVAAFSQDSDAESVPIKMLDAHDRRNLSLEIADDALTGTPQGLFKVSSEGRIPLWTEGEVRKILKVEGGAYLLTSKGIVFTSDFAEFSPRNEGIPVRVIKRIEGEGAVFSTEVQPIKDLKILPEDDSVLVCATNDAVFLSNDSAASWKSIGSISRNSGIKSVCVASLPHGDKKTLAVFLSHSIFSLAYCLPDFNTGWIQISDGLEFLETCDNADEVGDILAVAEDGETKIFLSQTFRPRLYSLDWSAKKADLLWCGEFPADILGGLCWTGGGILFARIGGLAEYDSEERKVFLASAETAKTFPFLQGEDEILCASFDVRQGEQAKSLSLSDLWLLSSEKRHSKHFDAAKGRHGLYAPVSQLAQEGGVDRYLQIMDKNRLDSIVVDMKDDFGLLHYKSENPLVLRYATTSRMLLDLETFASKMKARGKYLIARIVSFKDPNLYDAEKSRFACWNKRLKKPWQGIKSYEDEEIDGKKTGKQIPVYYDEFWVDPFSEEVWEYIVAIARELVERGFDEIQFDYIRSPTDGKNMADLAFRAQERGMDCKSALVSFLTYARERIDAPIGIDIYGNNGFYRTDSRTGQDVETLCEFVDVISPMFYPSHFEQTFMAQAPAEERAYRIYYYGSFRCAAIAQNRCVIRPWAQAFYMNVAYDRKYYDEDYVRRQVFGVRDSVDGGHLFWNNSGRYDDICPTIPSDEKYPWNLPEASFPHPVLR